MRFHTIAGLCTATLAITLVPSIARADACRDAFRHPRAPIALTIGIADFASTPGACAAQRTTLDVRGGLLIDKPDFYGLLGGEAVASTTWAPSETLWFAAAFDVYRFDYAVNASLVASQSGVGPPVTSAHFVVHRGEALHIATFVRLRFPIESGFQHAFRYGLEHGIAALYAISSRLALVGGLTFPYLATRLGERVHHEYTPRASLDGELAIVSWLEALAGVEVRVSSTAPDHGLEFVAPKAALRLHIGKGVDVHLETLFPIGGQERTALRGAIGATLTRW